MSSCCLCGLKQTRYNGAKFRTVTESLVLKLQGRIFPYDQICDSCRYRETTATDVVPPAKRKNVKPASELRTKICANPFGDHGIKRPKFCERFWKVQDSWLQFDGLVNPLTGESLVCITCRKKLEEENGKPLTNRAVCKNPFGLHLPDSKWSTLFTINQVTDEEIETGRVLKTELNPGDLLCSACRRELYKKQQLHDALIAQESLNASFENMEIQQEETASSSATCCQHSLCTSTTTGTADGGDDQREQIRRQQQLESFKQLLHILDLDELPVRSISRKDLAQEALNEIIARARNIVEGIGGRKLEVDGRNCLTCVSHVRDLAERLVTINKKNERYQLLTCTPSWVTKTDIVKFFHVSKRVADNVMLLKTREMFSAPLPKVGRPLPEQTKQLVTDFYLAPENSRVSPNERDVIVIDRKTVDGKTITTSAAKQKILISSHQLFAEFKNSYPDQNISLNSFMILKPKQCTWGFRTGFKETCLCIYHSNFKFLAAAIGLEGSTSELLKRFYCTEADECLLGDCDICPNWETLDDFLECNVDDDVNYYQWLTETGTSRVEVKQVSKPCDDFREYFITHVQNLAEHHLVYVRQKTYIKDLRAKENLAVGTAVMGVDFGQNFSFEMSKEVSSYYWGNKQATVHPFVMHYLSEDKMEVKFAVFVVISDTASHNATVFHAFKHEVITGYVKPQFPFIKSIVYVSDGAASQYKNYLTLSGVSLHEQDYGITARWVNSATAHGKHMCDAYSAIAKRLTRLESRRRTRDFILSAEEMVRFLRGANTDPKVQYVYISDSQINEIAQRIGLASRFDKYTTIPGTRQYHDFTPVGLDKMVCKKFSDSTLSTTHTYLKKSKPTPTPIAVNSYVAFLHCERFAVGLITNVCGEEYEIQLMAKSTTQVSNYRWPPCEKLVTVSLSDIIHVLTAPVPTTRVARAFKFYEKEISMATRKFEQLKLQAS